MVDDSVADDDRVVMTRRYQVTIDVDGRLIVANNHDVMVPLVIANFLKLPMPLAVSVLAFLLLFIVVVIIVVVVVGVVIVVDGVVIVVIIIIFVWLGGFEAAEKHQVAVVQVHGHMTSTHACNMPTKKIVLIKMKRKY